MTSKDEREEAEAEFYRRQELLEADGTAQEALPVDAAMLARLDGHWLRGLRILAQYPGNRDMALDCYFFAHGLAHMIPLPAAANPKGKPVDLVMLSVKWFGDRRHKETIRKCVALFQDALDLPAVAGQRSESGRKSMSSARYGQLKDGQPNTPTK